jgi:hypothetical protein
LWVGVAAWRSGAFWGVLGGWVCCGCVLFQLLGVCLFGCGVVGCCWCGVGCCVFVLVVGGCCCGVCFVSVVGGVLLWCFVLVQQKAPGGNLTNRPALFVLCVFNVGM